MKKCMIWLCLGIFIGFLTHSLWMNDKINPWKPVLEETSFQYLEYSVEDIIKGVQTIEEDLKNSKKEQPDKILHHTMNLLLKLEYYYLPITQVRQQIYDADRLLSLNQVQKAKDNLARAENRLSRIENSNENRVIKKAAARLDTLVKAAILEMDGPREQAVAKLEAAGAYANLMLLKGELVLSGVDDAQSPVK
ncbi:MAG: hypothetical protein DRH34_05305 [Deltaproteobacteria bacterium]|nr:MAG: hypothetical protein DRH34_05305 [Deltaproteobacteria bacterium]RLC21313.1 MAG: hypothetical protein DRH93_12020 [Deltaproteobacteria bacterium]